MFYLHNYTYLMHNCKVFIHRKPLLFFRVFCKNCIILEKYAVQKKFGLSETVRIIIHIFLYNA